MKHANAKGADGIATPADDYADVQSLEMRTFVHEPRMLSFVSPAGHSHPPHQAPCNHTTVGFVSEAAVADHRDPQFATTEDMRALTFQRLPTVFAMGTIKITAKAPFDGSLSALARATKLSPASSDSATFFSVVSMVILIDTFVVRAAAQPAPLEGALLTAHPHDAYHLVLFVAFIDVMNFTTFINGTSVLSDLRDALRRPDAHTIVVVVTIRSISALIICVLESISMIRLNRAGKLLSGTVPRVRPRMVRHQLGCCDQNKPHNSAVGMNVSSTGTFYLMWPSSPCSAASHCSSSPTASSGAARRLSPAPSLLLPQLIG